MDLPDCGMVQEFLCAVSLNGERKVGSLGMLDGQESNGDGDGNGTNVTVDHLGVKTLVVSWHGK